MSFVDKESKYIILINDDNTATVTQKRRIIQYSNLVDDLWFLVPPEYNNFKMAEFTFDLEYLSPVKHICQNETLTLETDTYNGYLKYILPIDNKITAEVGDVKLVITLSHDTLDESGNVIQRVRRIIESSIYVHPSTPWINDIPDQTIDGFEEYINKIDAQIISLKEKTKTASDSEIIEMLLQEDALVCVADSDGAILSDENGNILLW